ncbi:MAG: c-type cytochrome [Phaeodactylibacter sp.]|nr:c-type cytochrome [Phaeodactylibacter sp.]MCB9294195.1 c-type cytochrome [Lewinellaceae bacterium]
MLSATVFLSLQPAPYLADEDKPVAEVLEQLGDEPAKHQPDTTVEGISAERGRALVLTGFADKPNGGRTGKQSKHFVCTSCHNVQKDDPDLSVSDPQARLLYARDRGLPFLQGTALYGAVNRTSFYNGDYEKKYGSLVTKARSDLREAIQLCAVECSQGRALEPWEMESVLAYLWTIQLKMGDLNLSEKEYKQINAALAGGKGKEAASRLIKSRYLQAAPATFAEPPKDRREGYADITGDPANGKLVYELSCLHCHEKERYSFFNLDHARTTFRHLEHHFPRYTRYSVYQVARYGASPIPGKKAYMPNYTLEKMSHQQLEDLRAYVEEMGE